MLLPDMKKLILFLALMAVLSGPGFAVDTQTSTKTDEERTPSVSGARVYFIDVKDGDTLKTPTVIYFGLKEMGVAPAGEARKNSGHHHLLIDVDLPPLDQEIPNDPQHLHFGAGQTEAELTLSPGTAHPSIASWRLQSHSSQSAGFLE